MFVLGALAFLQAASPPAVADQLSNGRWSTMSTYELAALLLPPKIARRVAEHHVSPPATNDAPPAAVTFYTRPYAMPDGFCERDGYRVSIAADLPMTQSSDIRLGACPRSTGDKLAHVDPQLHPAQAHSALRWLAVAIAEARSRKPLPFDIDCIAEAQPSLCAGGGRRALAGLAVQDAFTVGGAFNCKTVDTSIALRQEPGRRGSASGRVWDVRIERGKDRPQLSMRWVKLPTS